MPRPLSAANRGLRSPCSRRPRPRHPFMAPNQRSNIHSDAFQTDTNAWSGPLGRETETLNHYEPPGGVCGSITFNSQDQIVTTCIQLRAVRLKLFDPRTLEELASMELPPRSPSTNPFQDFAGGGYFYLDNEDRAVIPTTERHLLRDRAERRRVRDRAGLRPHRPRCRKRPKIISALPDWSGRIWLATTAGVLAVIDPATGDVKSHDLGEVVQNSFAVGDEGDVYIVSEKALYRFEAGADGTPVVKWRKVYDNTGELKPGQVSAGSGTTPTLHGDGWVSITDNADPMHVVVYRRSTGRMVCEQAVFEKGAGSTDNSLIGAGHSLIVENNYGYTGPAATMMGERTEPGIERVDIEADGEGCLKVWHSDEISPSLVPKLSLSNGLVYVYTQDAEGDDDDPWFLTALDFRTGKTVWKRLVGQGTYFNNNYAPVTLGPDATAYVGVLGGLILVRDKTAPVPQETRPKIRLKAKRRGRRVRVRARAPSGGVVAPVRGAIVRVGKRTATTNGRGRATLRSKGRPCCREEAGLPPRPDEGEALSTFDKLAGLPLEVEDYELEGSEFKVHDDFTRLSTTIRIRGGGEEGIGEDVTYDALDHIALQDAGPTQPLAGSHTIGSFCELVGELDLFSAGAPVRDVSRLYRRWAFESAALDLALRQQGIPLTEPLELRGAAGHVRRLAPAGRAADARARRKAARALPDAALQARPDQLVDRRADRRARRHRCDRLRRLQGPVQGHGRRPAARPRAVREGGRRVPRRMDRGSGADRGDRADPRPAQATGSPGTRRSIRSPTSRRCHSRRRW